MLARLGHLLMLFCLAVCVTSVPVEGSGQCEVPSVVTSCASSSGVATPVSYRTHEGSGMWELRVFLGHRKEVTEQVLEAVNPWQYRL